MRPGTRVICIDDSMNPDVASWQPRYCPNWIKLDQKYTIREFDDNDGIVDDLLNSEILEDFKACTSFIIRINESFCESETYTFNMSGSTNALNFINN